jgi:hypothetical protein
MNIGRASILLLILVITGCKNDQTLPNYHHDYSNQSITSLKFEITDKHPSAYMLLANKLFSENYKDEAVIWFYVGQIRYRAYLKANPTLPRSGDPALFSSLMSVVGTPINEYAGGDIEAWAQQISHALTWHQQNPDGFLDKDKHAMIYAEIESGLKSLQNKIINDKENIRKQRVENGLENR